MFNVFVRTSVSPYTSFHWGPFELREVAEQVVVQAAGDPGILQARVVPVHMEPADEPAAATEQRQVDDDDIARAVWLRRLAKNTEAARGGGICGSNQTTPYLVAADDSRLKEHVIRLGRIADRLDHKRPLSLLPCPFCGSKDIWLRGTSGPLCKGCGAKADTIEKWNHRKGQ